MDGILVDLLNAKWNTFVKSRFYRQFFLFCFYFILSLISFTLRPGPSATPSSSTITQTPLTTVESSTTPHSSDLLNLIPMTDRKMFHNSSPSVFVNEIVENALISNLKVSLNVTASHLDQLKLDLVTHIMSSLKNLLTIIENETESQPFNDFSRQSAVFTDHLHHENDTNTSTFVTVDSTTKLLLDDAVLLDNNKSNWWDHLTKECRLMQLTTVSANIRLIAEIFMEFAAILYIIAALREARFLGLNMFIENLMTAPSRVMFLFSCCILLSFPFLRLSCADEMEDMLAVVVMLTTAPYFLFFCRGFKTVGPFVVMIYRMITGDLLRFVSIYLVFVIGFSQAYYIIFLSFDNPNTPEGVDDSISNPMPSPIESIMAMFLMSMTNFGDYYGAFERTRHEMEAKFMFVVYMAIVAILLVNMLIAMMGNTYQKIAETRNEWQRQWARIVLVVERGVSPQERLKKLMDYSQPMSEGRRALVLRLNQSEEDKEDMKEILEMKRTHDKLCKKRQLKSAKGKTVTREDNIIV